MNSAERLEAYRRRLVDEGVDAALVTCVSNLQYLTGFERVFDDHINAAAVITPHSAQFYTDSRYIEAATAAAASTGWEVVLQRESLYAEICTDLRQREVQTLAMESNVPYSRFRFISELFEGRVIVTDQWVEELRAVKEPLELDMIARAAQLTDRAVDHILGRLRPGMREIDVALELEVYMRSNGSQGLAFEPIIASGPNSSKPHAGITERVIEAGDFLTMDLGARIDGYCADLTRTVVVGARATDEQRRIYEAVLAANEAGLAAVRPGIACADLDRVARGVLEERGLGEAFGHGLGHGVGIDVHELPVVGPRSRDVLTSGHVITIEPGAYLPSFGGVRIEDLVAVVEGGSRLLSHAPKQLTEIV